MPARLRRKPVTFYKAGDICVSTPMRFQALIRRMAVWASYTGNVTSKTVAERAAALGLWLDSGENYFYGKIQSSMFGWDLPP